MEVMAKMVMAEVDEMVPDTDQNQVMAADSVEEGFLSINAQHEAKSAENMERKTTSRISVDLTDLKVRTTIGSRIMTKVKANTTDPMIIRRNSMRWIEMMALMTGMVQQPIENLDGINLTIIMTLFV